MGGILPTLACATLHFADRLVSKLLVSTCNCSITTKLGRGLQMLLTESGVGPIPLTVATSVARQYIHPKSAFMTGSFKPRISSFLRLCTNPCSHSTSQTEENHTESLDNLHMFSVRMVGDASTSELFTAMAHNNLA